MKVLAVIGEWPKLSETFVDGLHESVMRLGVDLRLVRAAAGAAASPAASPTVMTLRRRSGLPPAWPRASAGGRLTVAAWCSRAAERAAARLDAAWAPDIVHSHFIDHPAVLALELGRRLDAPVTSNAHSTDWRLHLDAGALRKRLKALDWIFPISRDAEAGLLAKSGLSTDVRTTVVRAFIKATDPEPPRVDLPIRYVATTARLIPVKGTDTLVRAMSKLPADVHLVVIGDGPGRGALEALVAELNLNSRVHMLGRLPHAEVLGVVRGAFAFALACRRTREGQEDGIPVSLMEAMRLDVPVVSTTVGGIPELVAHPDSGLLVEPDDPQAVAEALMALADAEFGRRVSAAARARLNDEFSPRTQAQRLISVWEGLRE